jgi:hypothetical protein
MVASREIRSIAFALAAGLGLLSLGACSHENDLVTAAVVPTPSTQPEAASLPSSRCEAMVLPLSLVTKCTQLERYLSTVQFYYNDRLTTLQEVMYEEGNSYTIRIAHTSPTPYYLTQMVVPFNKLLSRYIPYETPTTLMGDDEHFVNSRQGAGPVFDVDLVIDTVINHEKGVRRVTWAPRIYPPNPTKFIMNAIFTEDTYVVQGGKEVISAHFALPDSLRAHSPSSYLFIPS